MIAGIGQLLVLRGGTKAPRVLAVWDLQQRQCYSGIRTTSILLRQNCLHTNVMSSVQHSSIILFVSLQCLTSQAELAMDGVKIHSSGIPVLDFQWSGTLVGMEWSGIEVGLLQYSSGIPVQRQANF
jgi:hypothetical protein